MFGKKKSEAGISLIANNCEVSGDLRFKDQLLINGTVKGNIYAEAGSKAQVTVSEKGMVVGDIQAPNVVINGNVIGDIRSDRHIELAANAQIKGNVHYNVIEMVAGSWVEGSLIHDSHDQAGTRTQDAAGSLKGVERQAVVADKPATMESIPAGPPVAGGA